MFLSFLSPRPHIVFLFFPFLGQFLLISKYDFWYGRGYVALAVARERGPTVTREVETGSNDREGNMVSFAEAGLELLRDVIEMGSNTNVGANI